MKGLIWGTAISIILWALILGIAFADETFVKIDDNTVELTQTAKVVATYEQLKNRIDVLKGERDKQMSNLNLLNANIEALIKQLAEVEALGVKPKPVEVEEEIIE